MKIVENQFVWEQKFRPQTIDDVVLSDSLRKLFNGYVAKKQLPNFLFYSESGGTGKTTVAHALCNMLGIVPYFINGSSDNSIDNVRNDIFNFATTVSLMGEPFKVIIIDEFDRFSDAAQDAMKAMIEQVSSNCRFIFTTNSKSKINDYIISRCDVIDFVYNEEETKDVRNQMFKRTIDILNYEGITFDNRVVAKVVADCFPDNRKILNTLQSYSTKGDGVIDVGILSLLKQTDIKTLIDGITSKKFKVVNDWIFTNQNSLNGDFYRKLYDLLLPHTQPSSIPTLITILGEEQKYDRTVPDKYLHIIQTCVQLLHSLDFK